MNSLNYKLIVDKSPAGYAYHEIILNGEGLPCDYKFIDVNSAFEKMTGLKLSEIKGKLVTEVLPEIDKGGFDWIKTYGEVALTGKEINFEQYNGFLDKWFSVMAYSPEKNFFITLFNDITNERKSYTDLKEFFDINMDLLCIADFDGNFIRLSREWETALGYTTEELTGKSYMNFIHPEDREMTQKFVKEASIRGIVINFTNRYRCKDGSYRYFEWRSKPKGNLVYAVARDVTVKTEQKNNFQLLLNFSEHLVSSELSFKQEMSLYKPITNTLKELSGAKYVVFNLYNENETEYKTVYISESDENLEKAEKMLNTKIIGKEWYKPINLEAVTKSGGLTFFENIAELLKYDFAKPELQKVIEFFDIGQVVVASIIKDNKLIGDFTIIMQKGTELRNSDFIKIYIRQVSSFFTRLRYENALKNSEKLLKEVQAIARLGYWEFDRSSGMINFHQYATEIIETDPDIPTMSYKQYLRLVHPDDLKYVIDFHKKLYRSSESYEITYRINTLKGNLKWVTEIGSVPNREDGHFIRSLGTIQDVTFLKIAEENIKTLLKENEMIFNGTQDALFLLQAEGNNTFRYIKNNKAYEKKTGIARHEAFGKTPQNLFGNEFGDKMVSKYKECIESGIPLFYEETIPMPVGIRDWATTLTPVFENGKPLYIVGSKEDITERKKAQNRLLENLDNSEKLIELMTRENKNIQEFLDSAIESALSFTKSKNAYIFFYNEDEEILTLYSWANGSIEKSGVEKKQTVYSLTETGIWNEVVKQRKPILINDFKTENPCKKDFPKGHIKLNNFLSIPIFDKNKIVALAGVANKENDYNNDDLLQLTLLMNNAWSVVERLRSDEKLRKESELFKTTLFSIADGIMATDENGDVIIINKVAQTLTGWSGEEALGKPSEDVLYIINEHTRKVYPSPVRQVLSTKKVVALANHTMLISKNGTEYPIEDSAAPIFGENGEIKGVVIVFRDVTKERQKLNEIKYLSYHDQLTNLYNRAFYEEELKRLNTKRNLPITIVMADLNGLKLVNDAFGHHMGDKLLKKASEVIKSCCREDDIIARIGGDEFAILLPKTSGDDAEKIIKRIRELASQTYVGSVTLSISFGWEEKKELSENIRKVEKRAEDWMYRRKLFESPSMKDRTISSIIKALYETHNTEERHSKNLSKICEIIGRKLNLSERNIENLKTAGLLHDIGKITIDGSILNKKKSLTVEEIQTIRRHPETGYRILSYVNNFADISEIVLAHHERWDGNGYPKGLKGEDIPKMARIIALADTYETLINDKPYKAALSKQAALEEIKNNGGTQFDPELTQLFTETFSDPSIII